MRLFAITVMRVRLTGALVLTLLLGAASTLQAATVTATWNPNPEPDIAGYYLSYGVQSRVYTTTLNVGNVTSYPLTLTAGVTYYFAVQAYDTSGLTSSDSAEVSYFVPLGAPPTITGLTPASGFVGTAVTITGTNFGATQGASAVTFNGKAATPTSWSATSIGVPVPTGAATGSVVVTVGGVPSNAALFTVTTPVVTADSVTPNSGMGANHAFALQYSDTAGTTDLATTWVWFNATFASSAASSCMVYYNRATNTAALLNDTGVQWTTGTVGMAGTLQNTQCALSLASSTVVPSGNALTVTLAMTFAAGFNGAKNVYMYGASAGGASSGWQTRGTWTVPGGAVTANSVTPNAGTGAAQTFALQYGDGAGATDLATTWVWFNATFAASSANSCMLYYSRGANTVYLLNNAGTAWVPATVGSSGSLQNSQCALTLGSSTTVTVSGNTLTLNLAMTFAPGFSGSKNVYMYAANTAGTSSGWQTLGAWTVPGGAVVVTADSVSPNSGVGATQTFALQYSDTATAMDLTTTWVWFNATFAASGASSCMVYYDRTVNTVWLLNDAGATWMAGTPGSGGSLQNSQCALALGTTTVTLSGNALTLNLPMTFAPGFTGLKNVYMFADSTGGTASGWQTRGSWTP
jgi:hypothetical protein